MEQELRVQLIEVVDTIYLNALRNSDTDMIHDSLPKIMDQLLKNYGHVTLEDMHNKEQALVAMHFDPSSSVDAVFSTVDKFQDLCVLAE